MEGFKTGFFGLLLLREQTEKASNIKEKYSYLFAGKSLSPALIIWIYKI